MQEQQLSHRLRNAVSVVLPAHGACPYIDRAVLSLRSEESWLREILVVDDRMSPAARSTVSAIAEDWPCLRIIKSQGVGLVSALNTGLAIARGQFIGRMDADDEVIAGRFAAQLRELQALSNGVAIGGQLQFIDVNGRPQGYSRYPTSPDEVKAALETWCALAHPATLIRKSALHDVGGYREIFVDAARGTSLAEDYDLWLRLRRIGQLSNTQKTVLRYRRHEGQLTTRNAMTSNLATLGIQIVALVETNGGTLPAQLPVELLSELSKPLPTKYWEAYPVIRSHVIGAEGRFLISSFAALKSLSAFTALVRFTMSNPTTIPLLGNETLFVLRRRIYRARSLVE